MFDKGSPSELSTNEFKWLNVKYKKHKAYDNRGTIDSSLLKPQRSYLRCLVTNDTTWFVSLCPAVINSYILTEMG